VKIDAFDCHSEHNLLDVDLNLYAGCILFASTCLHLKKPLLSNVNFTDNFERILITTNKKAIFIVLDLGYKNTILTISIH